MSVFIDWLSYTLPVADGESADLVAGGVIAAFGGGCGAANPRYGYTKGVAVFGSGRVFWRPDMLRMGVHVELPSSALAEVPFELSELARSVVAAGGKGARVDVALDTDAVSVEEVVAMKDSGLLVTKLVTDFRIIDGRTGAITLNLGGTSAATRKTSGKEAPRRFVRVYDKGIEQGGDVSGVRTRFEVVLRKEYARAALEFLARGQSLEGLIVGAIDFRDRPELVNISERPRALWWVALVGEVKKVKLNKRVIIDTVVAAVEYIERQAGPTLALLSELFASPDWILGVIDRAKARQRRGHRARLAAWQAGWGVCV